MHTNLEVSILNYMEQILAIFSKIGKTPSSNKNYRLCIVRTKHLMKLNFYNKQAFCMAEIDHIDYN